MSTDDTCFTGGEGGSSQSTPPRPLPPAKRMRLVVTKMDTRKVKRKNYILAPLAKRFRFSEASSSSSSSPTYPLLLYASSPYRMSPDLLSPQVISSSESSTCSVALQAWCANSGNSPVVSATLSPSAVPLPPSSPSQSASGIYSPSSRTPSPSGLISGSISPSQVALPSSSPSQIYAALPDTDSEGL